MQWFKRKERKMKSNEAKATFPQTETSVEETLSVLFGCGETPAAELPDEEATLSIEIDIRGEVNGY